MLSFRFLAIRFENLEFTIAVYGETETSIIWKRVIVEQNGVRFGTHGY